LKNKIPSTTFTIPETFSVVVYCFCCAGLIINYSRLTLHCDYF
jgi:hypothetical protein